MVKGDFRMSRNTRRDASKGACASVRGAIREALGRAPCTKIGISGLTLGSITLTGPALAQDASQQQPQTTGQQQQTTGPSSDQLQEVVVTGIRASLQRSMEIKQDAVGVVDAVSAEDIGQFPDNNVGEAIARIPGVTVSRGDYNQATAMGAPTATGNVQSVSVRGFGANFDELLVEGRPIASGNGQNFNFSDLSANYVGEIDTHKTPDMSLSSGAVGATINVKFPDPFDHPGPQAQATYSENVYQNDGGFRPSFGALFSDTFADNTIGILIDGDYLDSHILGHHQDIVGWKGASNVAQPGQTPEYLACSSFAVAPAGSGCTSVGANAPGNSLVPSWYPQDMAMYLERTDLRNKDGRVAVQWHPMDAVLVTLDDNYSSYDQHIERWQRSTWFGAFPDAVQDANGTITSFDYTGPTDFNAFVADQYIVTNTPGINVRWNVNDHWTAALDADQSVSKFNPNGTYSDIDADVGYGNNANNYVGGLVVNPNNNVLPYWSAVGPNAVASGSSAVISPNYNGLNPFIIGSHVLPIQTQYFSDRINQVKLDAAWQSGKAKADVGVQYVDDLWNAKEFDTFTNNYWQLWSGYGPGSGNGPGAGVALPSSLFTPVSLGTWMPGFSGAGNLPSSLLVYNPYSVLNYLITQPVNPSANANAVTAGYPAYTGGIPAQVLSPSSVQHVDRENWAPFLTAQQTFNVGGMDLVGNLGLRYQRTSETIAGLAAPLESLSWNGTGDPTAYTFNLGTTTWTQQTFSYGYFLPALDLNLWVNPQLRVRFDASRTEDAPPNSDLIPNTSYGGRVNALTATGNNPYLLPYLADNFDLGAEWYYGSNDYVSVDGFLKRVTNFPTSSVQDVTVPGVTDPAPPTNPATGVPLSNTSGKPAVFAELTYTNAASATVHGVEVIWQQMLVYGFGYQVNGTYAHSNANFNPYNLTTNQFALPGVGNSANLIGFYQARGLQARLAVQWQGTQLLTLGQEQSGGAFGSEPVYLASSTELDYSMQYDFNSHLQGYFEALNLTDSVYHTYGRFPNQTLNLIDYGRSFTIGVRAKL